jgi:hypothetical protein
VDWKQTPTILMSRCMIGLTHAPAVTMIDESGTIGTAPVLAVAAQVLVGWPGRSFQ